MGALSGAEYWFGGRSHHGQFTALSSSGDLWCRFMDRNYGAQNLMQSASIWHLFDMAAEVDMDARPAPPSFDVSNYETPSYNITCCSYTEY